MRLFFLVLISLFFAGSVVASTTQAQAKVGENRLIRVDFAQSLDTLPVFEFTQIEFHLTDPDGAPIVGAAVNVSGGMRQHGHGLPTSPKVAEIADGTYRINGLKFSMTGLWELSLDVQAQQLRDTVVVEFGIGLCVSQ
ncbi:FixH family protein [Celeribacter marinus]|uniref:FixH family protein n=1 Tax=Celeribacter marinus TaxID=1397108 RepID=UPI003F6BAFA3